MNLNLIWLLIISGILFLIFGKYSHNQDVFKKGTNFEISLLDDIVIDKNGIGNEWYFESFANEEPIYKNRNYIIDVGGKKSFIIKSIAIEDDPHEDDKGIKEIVIKPKDVSNFLKMDYLESIVMVHEYNGNGAGKDATCKFTYSLKFIEN